MKKNKDKEKVILPQLQTNPFPYFVDPLGSYTGRPVDVLDEPVQDADDL